MLHYNFPPFSTGEVRPMRGTSRREIGHGNLAERALQAVLPTFEDFPYTIRIVSDILESNGSSSMASVCGGSLALFDAGVPMRAAVAGVAMGLIKEGKKYAILTDILGTEDHLGDMDFKVAGTKQGITSIQMDIKIEGLDLKIMEEALAQAKEGRLHILGEMDKALAAPAWRSRQVRAAHRHGAINPEKIGDLIGPKGKTIRGIQDETGAELTVDDDGTGHHRGRRRRVDGTCAPDGAGHHRRSRRRRDVRRDGEDGDGLRRVHRDHARATEGLLHVSEMKHTRVEKPEDVVKKGDRVTVKLIDRDERGRLRLSMKALLPRPEGMGGDAGASVARRDDGDRDRGRIAVRAASWRTERRGGRDRR
jgi:polyribonucleotide nucleotidyltransferase